MIHRYYAAVRLLGNVHAGRTALAFSRRPAAWFAAGISEVSRFSCMKFLGVSGVYDYAGLTSGSRYRPCSCCLPHILDCVGVLIASFRSSIPSPPIPLFTLRCDTSRCHNAKLGAERIANPFS